MSSSAILWFRRDLRLYDHAALLAAARRADSVLAVFVLDDNLLRPAGANRRDFLYGCLRELDERLGGGLLIRRGDPAEVLPELAERVGAASVHVSADTNPYGSRRDERVRAALEGRGIDWEVTGSPYAVTPGRITKADGTPYRVFTPFRRAWSEHGWPAPAETGVDTVDWLPSDGLGGLPVPDGDPEAALGLPPPGETAALRSWHEFVESGDLAEYHSRRDRPDTAGTSRMSAYLRWGCVHPRTLLCELSRLDHHGAGSYRNELAFREFYADVLWNWPGSARHNFDTRFDRMPLDTGAEASTLFDVWCEGRTGFPVVDAGMRQLLHEGWMHNRVRMIVASFLVKDLHLPWWWGARHFMRHLVDGDLASNQHGWQWAAGSGTDAAPYFRVFNPTTQGEKFDPSGEYVRRYVPELRGLAGARAHRPWRSEGSPAPDYPAPLVDHAHERQEALARYGRIKNP
ncbi:deoxyribodipyrimidine photolyase [Actinopolyspora erythraea]|uniref:Deoxyribodipyrimidine photolyase n=1 Tax=Actinopolyspora erythraea TaxID=414996 RepID=A0ABR4X3Z6_9ACTN|nr:deoxyribodipyrimidine photo-lyase [Actinopolyspora erythraea]KGI81354.1 deoxyribodipyrimidine photolyase [Actinopolyspora erythraea]